MAEGAGRLVAAVLLVGACLYAARPPWEPTDGPLVQAAALARPGLVFRAGSAPPVMVITRNGDLTVDGAPVALTLKQRAALARWANQHVKE